MVHFVIGVIFVVLIEVLFLDQLFKAIKRTIPRLYVLLPFVYFTVAGILYKYDKRLARIDLIEKMNDGTYVDETADYNVIGNFLYSITQMTSGAASRLSYEITLIGIYLMITTTALIAALICFRNKPLRIDFLNSFALSLVFGVGCFLFRWIFF